MFYGNTKSLLESIIRSLEPRILPENEGEWQAQTELVQGCLAEMVEMSDQLSIRQKGPRSHMFTVPLRTS